MGDREKVTISGADVGVISAAELTGDKPGALTQAEKKAVVLGVTRTCRGPKFEGQFKGCGYDVNKLILAEPLDGGNYEATCPECGSLIQWTAPRFDE